MKGCFFRLKHGFHLMQHAQRTQRNERDAKKRSWRNKWHCRQLRFVFLKVASAASVAYFFAFAARVACVASHRLCEVRCRDSADWPRCLRCRPGHGSGKQHRAKRSSSGTEGSSCRGAPPWPVQTDAPTARPSGTRRCSTGPLTTSSYETTGTSLWADRRPPAAPL